MFARGLGTNEASRPSKTCGLMVTWLPSLHGRFSSTHTFFGPEELQSVERERRSQHVAAQVLEPLALVLVHGHLGVEVPAVDARLAPGGQHHEPEPRLLAGATPLAALRAGRSGAGLQQSELFVRHVLLGRREQRSSPSQDASEDLLYLVWARCRCGKEAALSLLVFAVGAVQEQAVKVQVESQVGAKSLVHRHRAAARRAQPRSTCHPPVVRLDGPRREAREGQRQLVVERRPNPQPERKREHPLPHANALWEHALSQVARPLRHAPAAAARAESAPFARQARHSRQAAALALEARAPRREPVTVEVAFELSDDEAW